ncbi:peptidoglycan DD-metalloendopeptidase family protein [Streptomyces uncialis]|uniref:aggregation-promoting factor C-terminal-like domain-containing protein n=1 Tax=Streptomyces uncialis TaxID=1048205 RepID=UPI003823F8BD
MAAITVGSVEIDIIPNTQGIYAAMQAQVADIGDRLGEQIGQRIASQITQEVRSSLQQGITQGGRAARPAAARQGEQAGGAFARSIRARLEAAFRNMPHIEVGLNDTGVDADLARLRARLESLADRTIGVDIDAATAREQAADIEQRLQRLGALHPNIAVRADTASAIAELRLLQQQIDDVTRDPARVRVETDGGFGGRLRAAVQQAQASLPHINLTADSTPAQAEIARLRAQLTQLADARIGIDIDSATALATVEAVQVRLQALAASDADVAVRVDAGAAFSQLAAVQAMVNRLDRDDVRIRVHANTGPAIASFMLLGATIAGVAAIPLAPILLAGLGAVASMATVTAAGLGSIGLVAIPAIKGVTTVLQAKKQASEEAAQATDSGAAAEQRAAQQALQVAGAQSALTSARRQAAQAAAQAGRQIADAERGVGDAARRVADQRRQAAETTRQAVDTVRQAERSLADAQRDARQAEEELTQARADAVRQLEEQRAALDERLRRSSLDQRDARLRLSEAHAELQKVLADPKASELQRARAQLTRDQAQEAVRAQATEQADLVRQLRQTDRARREGVEGQEAVRSAAERAAEAERQVQERARGVADAQAAAARASRDAAEATVEAQRGVADAQRAVADAVARAAEVQVESAERIASAERGIESARASGIDTTVRAATAQDEYRDALAKLSPAQRELYDSIAGPDGLSAAFTEWQTGLQPDVLPIFTRGVKGAKGALPGLTTLVKNSAGAVSDLQDDASRELKDPFWSRFKRGMEGAAGPAIKGFGRTFGNVFKGMAGVVEAFFPHLDDISDWMGGKSEKFADWATSLKGSPEFEGFLGYVKETGPKVGGALREIGGAVFEIGQALSPLSGPVLDVIGTAADGIGRMAEKAPWLVQGLWGIVAATAAWSFVLRMSPIGRVVWLVGLLAAGVIAAYEKFPVFREIVDTAWAGIKDATEWVWVNVLEPFFSNVWGALQWVGDKVKWIWDVILAPFFGWLWDILKWIWDKILWPFFKGFWDALAWVGGKLKWIWDEILVPFFDWLAPKLGWVWDKVLWPFFKGFWDGLAWVGDKLVWLWRKGRDTWNWLGEKADWLYAEALKPSFDSIKSAIGLVGDAFEGARKAIKKAWDKIEGITKGPVNFVIDFVYTNGIKAVWDKIAGFVGLSKLPDAPKLLEAGGTVGSGFGPAAPMRVNRPTAIVGEGNPRYPEFVIPTDPKYRDRALSLHQAAGTRLMERGGVLGGLEGAWDWTKDTVSDVVGTGIDWAKKGADLLTNPSKVWKELVKPVLSRVAGGVGTSRMGKMVGRIPLKMTTGLKDKIVDAVSGLTGGGGSGGGGQWLRPVNAAFGTRYGVSGPMWASGRHTGLDFPAAVGTAVRAAAGGSVQQVSAGGGPYGKYVILDHGGSLSSLYAHLSSAVATKGGRVGAGDLIGRVGATGNVTGPHLHFEARRLGRAVDPMPFLSGGGGGAAPAGAAQTYARSILGRYGWGPGEFSPLKKLWERESNWRWNARNPSSGAYGIPQSLPASKMAAAGADWRTNPQTQIRWGLGYIKGHPNYGSPSAAYAKFLSRSPNWYDSGGMLQPGLNLAYNGTGRPEPVLTGRQWDTLTAASGTPQLGDLTVQVFVGDREITDIARTEIRSAQQELISVIQSS